MRKKSKRYETMSDAIRKLDKRYFQICESGEDQIHLAMLRNSQNFVQLGNFKSTRKVTPDLILLFTTRADHVAHAWSDEVRFYCWDIRDTILLQ
jgi:hypothetical protein